MFLFLVRLIHKSLNDHIFDLSNGLTYKILLAFFPLLVFLMSLLGFLNLNDSSLMAWLDTVIPSDVSQLVNHYVIEIFQTRSTGLLSTSLFFCLYNTTNGFRAVIRSINKAYGYKEERGIHKQIGVSLLLMLTFIFAIVVMMVLLIFGNNIIHELAAYLPGWIEAIYASLSAVISMLVLVMMTTFMYVLACAKKVSPKDVLPGAIITVLLWVVSSKLFSYFISINSQYSAIYGSIAGVFILIIWLNLISLFLLVGNEINSLLMEEEEFTAASR